MKSEKLKTPGLKGEYKSPKTKVVSVNVGSILCSSPGAGENEEGGEQGGQGF